MQVVIKISEEDYNNIKEKALLPFHMAEEEIIANGVVLPKEHGRLIDGDYLYDKFKANGIENIENGSYALQLIKDEPTVLEADGGI